LIGFNSIIADISDPEYGCNSISNSEDGDRAAKKLEKLYFLRRRMGWGENSERIGRLE
jgi:hypothetical protein